MIDNGVLYIGVSSGEEIATQIPGYPCCSFRGSVVALDAATGKIKWQTPMIEDSVFYKADDKTLGRLRGRRGLERDAHRRSQPAAPLRDDGQQLRDPEAARPTRCRRGITSSPSSPWIWRPAPSSGSTRMVPTGGSVWTVANGKEPDYDFGCGANLYQTTINGTVTDVVGAGQKSGVYWALDADTGGVLWSTQVGPGGHLGGIHWSTAVDSHAVYVGVNDETGSSYTMGGSGPQAGKKTSVGSWAALDLAGAAGDAGASNHGKILWQIANPAMTAPLKGGSVNGPPRSSTASCSSARWTPWE